jgi:hypothetical protein
VRAVYKRWADTWVCPSEDDLGLIVCHNLPNSFIDLRRARSASLYFYRLLLSCLGMAKLYQFYCWKQNKTAQTAERKERQLIPLRL